MLQFLPLNRVFAVAEGAIPTIINQPGRHTGAAKPTKYLSWTMLWI